MIECSEHGPQFAVSVCFHVLDDVEDLTHMFVKPNESKTGTIICTKEHCASSFKLFCEKCIEIEEVSV